MSKKDMWGDIENAKLPRNPKEILKEQADVIGEKTKYVLKGRVISGSPKEQEGKPLFSSALVIDAKRLDNYTYNLLMIDYSLEMYPVKMYSFPSNENYTCNNEGEFVERLEKILSSEEVMKTIKALFSQSSV